MRAIFGLCSLLICAFIMAYVWSMHTAAVSHSATQALDQANQISGRGKDGQNALKSITLAPGNVAGRLKSLKVEDIVAGGAMDEVYGLQKGDEILIAGNYAVDTNDDFETASSMLLEAYRGTMPLQVRRGGQTITLPLSPGQGQLDSIRKQLGQ